MVETAGWLRTNGDPEGARRLLEQALELDPANTAARVLLSSFTPARPPDSARGGPTGATQPSAWDAAPGARVVIGEHAPGPGADPLRLVSASSAPGSPRPASSRAEACESADVLLQGVRDLLELDDHSGAMDLLAKAEQHAPDDPAVQHMRKESERVLMAMLESKLGDLHARPRVRLEEDEIIWLNLDHRAGFVLAQIDGTVSYDDLFAVSGMSRLDTARILAQLVGEGVIG
ncbi:MAG: tetratricopeptide repeat protein [Myxococcaceae bacterium]|nr:tetratricopeptide repeat protein [Myxococcaceae bacterium]MCI0672182.1 tetratricopeptide repeat protein [Myxococcaceae bacterium]